MDDHYAGGRDGRSSPPRLESRPAPGWWATSIGPGAMLAGCAIGQAAYVATQVMVFQGARVGSGCRLGAGSIVHTAAEIPERTRVGMRHIAVPDADADAATLITAEVKQARRHLAHADFFDRVFGIGEDDPADLHRRSIQALRREAAGWDDLQTAVLPEE